MSRWSDTSDEDRRREERREYERDVFYDVWRSGRDTDRIDDARVADHYYRGDSAESAAAHEIRIQRQAEEARQEARDYEAEQERHYYEQLQEQPENP